MPERSGGAGADGCKDAAVRRFMLCLGTIALLASAGCGDDRALKAELNGRRYLGVATSDPRAVTTPSVLRLEFSDEGLSATGGCNDTSGSYKLGGRKLRFGDDAMQTAMGCVDGSERQDDWLNDLLAPSADLELRDGGRTLILRRGQRSATFGLQRLRGGPSPVDRRSWRATAFVSPGGSWTTVDGEMVRPAIRIEAGTATIFTGCNRGTATVQFGERTVTFSEFRPTTRATVSGLRGAHRPDRSRHAEWPRVRRARGCARGHLPRPVRLRSDC